MYLFSTTVVGGDGIPESQAVPKGLAFHPCAPGLIASRGLRKISLCDLTSPQAPCLSIGGETAFSGVSRETFLQGSHVFCRTGTFDNLFERRLGYAMLLRSVKRLLNRKPDHASCSR